MKRIWVVLAVVLLAACESEAEKTARLVIEGERDQAECVGLGFTPQTENFSLCRLQMRVLREAKKAGAWATKAPARVAIVR